MQPELTFVTDQLDRQVGFSFPPRRIVSLVPSITELLFALELEQTIIGRTKFCIHPKEKVKAVKQIGGTKSLHLHKIRELKPDLILANQEENTRDQIVELSKDFPVWISNIRNFEDAIKLISGIGYITDRSLEAELLVQDILDTYHDLEPLPNPVSVLYLIWQKPLMAVGSDTFIDAMLKKLGFRNVLADLERYPEVGWQLTERIHPDYVFLSSEPFPFGEKHMAPMQKVFPYSKIKLVDGSYFSWYGWRLLPAAAYFKTLLSEIRD